MLLLMLSSFSVQSPGGIFSFSFFFFFLTKVHLFYRYLRVVVYDEKIYSNASPPSLRKQPLFCDATIGFPWKCQTSGGSAKYRQISQATNPTPSRSMLLSWLNIYFFLSFF